MFYIQTLFIGLFKFYCLLFSFTSAGLYVINLKDVNKQVKMHMKDYITRFKVKKKMIQKMLLATKILNKADSDATD